MSLSEMVMFNAIRHVEMEKKMLALNEKVEIYQQEVNDRVLEVEAKITTKDTDFYTISGWVRKNGYKVDKSLASKLGRLCSSICNNRKLHKGKEYDAKYGEVNTYPTEILREVFENYFED